MNLDLEQIMILLQKRYRAFQEINRLTVELGSVVSRRDEVSASLLLADLGYVPGRTGGSITDPRADDVRSRRRPSVREL